MSGKNGITYVGLDAHKKAINVAVRLETGRKPIEQWQIANEEKSVKRMIRKVEKLNPGAEIQRRQHKEDPLYRQRCPVLHQEPQSVQDH